MSPCRLASSRSLSARHSQAYLLRKSCLPRTLATRSQPAPWNNPSGPSSLPTVDVEQVINLKHPRRGGQDLSRRYQRLERSIRGKAEYGREIQGFQRAGEVPEPAPFTASETVQTTSTSQDKGNRRVFRGLVIPERPKPPADDGTFALDVCAFCPHQYILSECCMSGCAVCVYDLYDEARTDYIQAVDKIRADLVRMSVPEHEWPPDIRSNPQDAQSDPAPKATPVLNAFEQLELALKAKKEKAVNATPNSTASTEGSGS